MALGEPLRASLSKTERTEPSGSDMLPPPWGWRAPADGGDGRHADGLLSGVTGALPRTRVDLLVAEDRPVPRLPGAQEPLGAVAAVGAASPCCSV